MRLRNKTRHNWVSGSNVVSQQCNLNKSNEIGIEMDLELDKD